jgi:hypothetical protein
MLRSSTCHVVEEEAIWPDTLLDDNARFDKDINLTKKGRDGSREGNGTCGE